MNFAEMRIDGQPMESSPNPGSDMPSVQGGAESQTGTAQESAESKSLNEQIIDALHEIYDPEIPVDIYELGLIYDVDINEKNEVHINMTLTSPACPVAESLPLEVRAKVGKIREVTSCQVEIVFDPPWTPERLSDVAKLKLGMF